MVPDCPICMGTPASSASFSMPAASFAGGRLYGREGAGLEQGLEGRQTRGGRQRVAGERARLVDGTGRGHHLHDGPLASVGPQGKPSAYHLAQAGQIGLQSPETLGASEPEPEPGYHLVQYEQGARLPTELLDPGQEARVGA